MMRKCHVRFSGGREAVTPPGYPVGKNRATACAGTDVVIRGRNIRPTRFVTHALSASPAV
jgi:hypothetical protein